MANDIYLSSTLDDLRAERDAARDVLGKQGYGIKDSYQASENDVIASCLDDVAKCSIYVCIVGMRYGYRPASGNPDDRSITQLEFEQAQRLNLPCFAFVKSDKADYKAAFLDSYTSENAAGARIKAFREWVATQSRVRPSQFETIQELREKLLGAILSYEQKKAGTASSILRSDARHRAELTADVGLVLHPSADATVFAGYRSEIKADPKGRRFKPLDHSADAAELLSALDGSARDCRALCWLLTPSVIQSYKDNVGVLTRAIRDQRRRRGGVGALLAGGATPAALPGDWDFDVVIEADPLPSAALDQLYAAMRARVRSIRPDRRVGVPCLVFAMNRAEAQALASSDALMAAVQDAAERQLRVEQVRMMLAAIRNPKVLPQWPQDSYGDQREDWRPFGPREPSARDYLVQAAERINDGEPSKRERLFIKGSASEDRLRLQLLHYSLDEVAEDVRGSQAAVLSACDRGCVILVDELALLHPALRRLARVVLRGENVAVLCSQPADPAPYPVGAVLTKDSSLQVGSLMTRFRDEHDPRCEVAINSPQRLQRWLRLVLPELVPTLGGDEAQTTLVNKPDEELFGRKVPG